MSAIDHHDDHADEPWLQHHWNNSGQQFEAGKLGMWLFLATEFLLFAGLFCAYAVYRSNHPELFEYGAKFLDWKLGATNTAVPPYRIAFLAVMKRLHDAGVEHVWIHLGVHGSLLSTPNGVFEIDAVVATEVVDVTGAGDAMLAGFCHGLLRGDSPKKSARFGMAAAALTVASAHTVVPELSDALVREQLA